jgi:hypothetical protein
MPTTTKKCYSLPQDREKKVIGVCGCRIVDSHSDSDNDGALDCRDECPKIIDKTVPGLCGCGEVDTDSTMQRSPKTLASHFYGRCGSAQQSRVIIRASAAAQWQLIKTLLRGLYSQDSITRTLLSRLCCEDSFIRTLLDQSEKIKWEERREGGPSG